MEDEDAAFSFDFEGGLDAVASGLPGGAQLSVTAALPGAPAGMQFTAFSSGGSGSGGPAGNNPAALGGDAQKGAGQGGSGFRRTFRQTVCRHWLRGLCMKGEACGFLHILDKARMPICRFFAREGECREPDCIYKHSNEDIRECNMYKLGFCPNGPVCRYRHIKLPGPFPNLEESLEKVQQRPAVNGSYQAKYSTQRHAQNQAQEEGHQTWPARATEDSQNKTQPQPRFQQQPQAQAIPPQNEAQASQEQTTNSATPNQPNIASSCVPLPQGQNRYFIVKSSNRENLELSVERGMWATHRNNESKLNDAFDSCEHVILIFSVNETGHFQGCAKMISKIGGVAGGGAWKYAHGTAHYGRNFRLKWLKLCELPFSKTRHLRNPFNKNLPVKISRDCQELEPVIGEQLASLLYTEPDSDLMRIANEVQSKREEEKARGGSYVQDTEDTNIVPYEDNDDDQEDEESDEEDSSSQTPTVSQNRGKHVVPRGGQKWAPHGPTNSGGKGGGGAGGMSRLRNVGNNEDSFNMGLDRFGGGEGYNNSGAGPPGRGGYSSYGHSGPRYANSDFSNVGPGPGPVMGFGSMEGAMATPGGLVFAGRPPAPNGIFPRGPAGIMGIPGGPILMPAGMMGAGRPAFLGGQHMQPMGMPFRPPPGVRGRRGGVNDPRRRRNDRFERFGDSRNPPKLRQHYHSVEESPAGDTDADHLPPQEDGSASYIGSKSLAGNNEDGSESEDEAPRRSRHGGTRKKKRE